MKACRDGYILAVRFAKRFGTLQILRKLCIHIDNIRRDVRFMLTNATSAETDLSRLLFLTSIVASTTMSARQPFVPQRPVSNHPDPKSQTLNANSDADAAPKESKSQANSMDFGPTNKPLNISGLIKPRSSHKQQNPKPNSNSNSGIGTPTLKVRSSFEGIQRPPKPAIFSKNQGSLKLRLSSTPKDQNQSQSQSHLQNQNLQASPFFPASNSTPSSGFLAMSSNATATFGGLPLFQVNANTVSNGKDAHIPTFASESAMTPLVTSNPDSSFEKIQESAEEPPSSPSVTCAVGDASATALGSSGDVTRGLGIAVRSQFESGSGRMKRKNNRVEDEEDQLEEEGVEYERTGMKRWKGDNGEVRFGFRVFLESCHVPLLFFHYLFWL